MPAPIAAVVAGASARVIGGAAAGAVVGSAMTPVGRTATYDFNYRVPNCLPDWGDLLDAHLRGKMSWQRFRETSFALGINLPPVLDRNGNAQQPIWRRIVQAKTPHLSLDLAQVQWWRGQITDEQVAEIVRWHGFDPERFIPHLLETWTPLNPVDLITLLNRGVINTDEVHEQLGASGYGNVEDRLRLIELAKQIPGPSDLITFAYKEVWDRETVRRFGYDEEFPPEFAYWMKKVGYNWGEDVTLPDGTTLPGVTWPQAYWRSHWDVISPQQAYEMQHRLRGNQDNPATWRVPGVRPWSLSDTRQILKIHDYPPPFRDQLAAISYNVLGFRQIQWLMRYKLVDDAEANQLYQDAGYTQEQAGRLVQIDKRRLNDQIFQKIGHEDLSRIKKQYEVGTLTRESAAVALYRLKEGLPYGSLAEIQHPPAADIEIASNDPYINNALATIDAEWNEKIVAESIDAVKHNYLHGVWTKPQATAQLMQMQISHDRILSYFGIWDAYKLRGGKEAGASKNIEWYVQHIISRVDAQLRLTHLGFVPRDIELMLLEADNKLLSLEAKARAREEKDKAAQIKAHNALIRQAQQQRRQAMRDLAASLSAKEIVSAAKNQLLSIPIARRRLIAIGHTPIDADLLLAEGLKTKSAGVGKSGAGTTTNGTAGAPSAG